MEKLANSRSLVNRSDSGYVKFHRSGDAADLMRKPNAFVLLALIASRARWQAGLSPDGLAPGQAFIGIGDYAALGLTERKYRTAKDVLERMGYATFDGRNKGTVATLLSQTVFDINIGWEEEKERRAKDGQVAGK